MRSRVFIGRGILRGGAWVVAAAVVNAVTTIVINGLLARLMDPTSVGMYFALYSASLTAASLCLLGMNQSIVRLVSNSLAEQRPDRAKASIRSAVIVLFATLSIFGVVLYSHILPLRLIVSAEPQSVGIAYFFLWTGVLAVRTLMAEAFRGFHEIGAATLFSGLLTSIFTVIALAVLIELEGAASIKIVLFIVIGATLLVAAISSWRLVTYTRGVATGPPTPILSLIRRSFPLLGSTAGFLLRRDSHLWLLAMISPMSEVATLGAALYFVRFLTVPLALMNSLIQPFVAHLHATSEPQKLKVLLRGSASCVAIGSFCGLIIVALFGRELLSMVYGEHYTTAYIALLIISVGQLINVGTGSPGVLLAMSGNEQYVLVSSLLAASVGLSVTLAVAPVYGANGAATGIASAVALHNLAMWIFARRRVGIWTHASWAALLCGLGTVYRTVDAQKNRGVVARWAEMLLRPFKDYERD
ncbi:MAG: oligosaccharide flippase family protein [Pseudomonadales bacterium]